MPVRVQTEDFDAGAEIARLRRGDPKIGAVASFIGVVRDVNDGAAVGTMYARALSRHDRQGARGIVAKRGRAGD